MVTEALVHLLARVARSTPAADSALDPAKSPSILSLSAVSYGARPAGDVTTPTGFDPVAARLFEAIIEAAYLMATADGVFDDEERRMFERIVVEACGGAVGSQQVTALVADLHGQLRKQGLAERIAGVAANVSKKEHAREVLRIAALIGQASDGANTLERAVLAKIAADCGLGPADVDAALASATSALAYLNPSIAAR